MLRTRGRARSSPTCWARRGVVRAGPDGRRRGVRLPAIDSLEDGVATSSTVGSCRTRWRSTGVAAIELFESYRQWEAGPRRQLHHDLRHRPAPTHRRRVPPVVPYAPPPASTLAPPPPPTPAPTLRHAARDAVSQRTASTSTASATSASAALAPRSARPQEVEQDPVERRGVLDHETVGGAADHDQLGGGDPLGELLGVAARREDVLVADHHQGRHGDLAELVRRASSAARIAPTWAAKACVGRRSRAGRANRSSG